VLGVQGRYYLVPLLMFALIGTYLSKLRWPRLKREWLACSCTVMAGLLCMVGNIYALSAIHRYFYL
jgi:hypothetical protein